jgi:hypothetical protein
MNGKSRVTTAAAVAVIVVETFIFLFFYVPSRSAFLSTAL